MCWWFRLESGAGWDGGRDVCCMKHFLQEQRANVCLMWKLDSLNPSLLIFHKLQGPLGISHFSEGNKINLAFLFTVFLFCGPFLKCLIQFFFLPSLFLFICTRIYRRKLSCYHQHINSVASPLKWDWATFAFWKGWVLLCEIGVRCENPPDRSLLQM